MRWPLFGILAILPALCPTSARAGAAEILRWQLGPDQGIVFKVSGADPKALCDGTNEERTLYGPEIHKDGARPAARVGRPIDLIFHYLFSLPPEAVEPGTGAAIDETHSAPPYFIGALRAQGERRYLKKQGPISQIVTTVRISRGEGATDHARFQEGTLTTNALFHAKKGTLISGDFDFNWTEKNDQKIVTLARKGTLEAVRMIDLSSQKLRSQVDQAVKRGVDKDIRPYLEKAAYRSKGPDHALGSLAIALYAGTKAGLDPWAPPLGPGFDEIDKLPWKGTYSVALALLALEARSIKRVRTRRAGETRERFEKVAVEKRDLERMEKLARWLIDARTPGKGLWHYHAHAENKPGERDGDLSISQFAVLALHAAARSGIKIPNEVWREVVSGCFHNQEGKGEPVALDARFEPGASLSGFVRPATSDAERPAGERGGGAGGTVGRGEEAPPGTEARSRPARGFVYYPPGFWRYAYTSMTGAGVSSLAIARTWLRRAETPLEEDLGAKIDDGIADGLAWLQRGYSPRHNWPEHAFMPFYCFYSLEKAYEITRIERLGGHDWWSEGAQELLLREKPGGGWGGEAYDTAFAILFLTRASAEPEFEVREKGVEASGEGAKADDPDAVLVEGTGLVRARDVIRAAEVKDPEKRRSRLEIAEKAIAGLEAEKRPIVAAALGRLLGSAYPECKRFAEKQLKEIAGGAIEDEAAAESFQKRWDETTKIGVAGDFEQIAFLRARLKEETLSGLRRAAALALSRVRAVEAIPDLVGEMERADASRAYKGYIRQVLVGTVGQDQGEDPQKWRDHFAQAGEALCKREEVRRDVQRLGREHGRDAARTRLLKHGRAAVRALIDGLQETAGKDADAAALLRAATIRTDSAALLKEITGKDFGEDRPAWEAWWREEGQK